MKNSISRMMWQGAVRVLSGDRVPPSSAINYPLKVACWAQEGFPTVDTGPSTIAWEDTWNIPFDEYMRISTRWKKKGIFFVIRELEKAGY